MSNKLPELKIKKGCYLGMQRGMEVYDAPYYPVEDVELYKKAAKKLKYSNKKLKAENKRLRDALLDIKNGKDCCY